MENFYFTAILKISVFCFLSAAISANSSNSVVITPSPSAVNGSMQSTSSIAQANSTAQATGNMSSTIAVNQTYVSPQPTALPGGQPGQGQGQGQGGQGGQGGQSGQSNTAGQSASVSPSSTPSVVLQQTPSPGGQSGQSNAAGQPASESPSSTASSVLQQLSAYLETLSPEQKKMVEEFDTKLKQYMQKLEIASEVKPLTSESADSSFLPKLGSLLEDSQRFGKEFDSQLNAKPIYTVNTTSTVLRTKTIDCVSQRVNRFPEHMDPHSTGPAANLISLPLQCPMIVKQAPVSRKRRDLDYSVELKWDHHSKEDPVEYVHMYRYIRARREAAEQQNSSCSQSPCLVNGAWSEWTAWSTWPDSSSSFIKCGVNFRVRRDRNCTDPSPKNGGKKCEGPSVEYKKCNCSGTFENTGGTISSPYWSSRNYPFDTECVWILKAPFNHSVVLKFDEFNLESDKKCFYDYVQVFDGNDTSAPELMPNTCGTKGSNRTLKSSDTIMMIKFRSDKTVNDKGFKATWTNMVQPWKPPKPIEYEEQNVTVTNLIFCPTYNNSFIPLGKATTCLDKSSDGDCYFENPAYLISCVIGVKMSRNLPLTESSTINATFKHIMHKDLFPGFYTKDKFCVTWNQSLSKLPKQAWTRKGCSVYSTNVTHTTCKCDHTGIFAVLASEKVVYKKLTLLANTYSGIGISFFLILLAIFHIVWKVNIHGGEVMRMNICVAIIVMMIAFLIGANVEAEKTLCGFLTFLLLFSVFAQFLWLMLHGLRIHGKIKEVFAAGFNIEVVYVVFGWGLPLVLSLIAIGIQVEIKNEKDVCWTAIAGGSMWGYSAPLLVIILLNMSVLIAILIPTTERKTKYDYRQMTYRVFKDGVLLVLFGVTCLTAYLTVAYETFAPQYFLTISVILQAVAMIIFGREGRKDFVKLKEKKVDMADSLSQNTNEEDFPERFDEESMSDRRSSKKSGKSGINSPGVDAQMKSLKSGKHQETDIDA